jgi:WD40 repeat protein
VFVLVKAFRLFVSSTFADFAQERELLQGKVFPALDSYCAAKGYQFLPLDLRWGISEEAQLDQRTAEICLGEVHAAKDYPPPNFLIMIGNRYGWVPLPYGVARDEFEAVIAWLKGRWKWGAVRALRTAYQLDENHLVPRGLIVAEPGGDELVSAYTLRSREDEIPDLKSYNAWAKFEARLRRTFQQAADHLLKLGRMNAAAHQKYFLSVTEQEIRLGLLGYQRGSTTFTPPSPTTDASQATAFIREIAGSGGRALASTSSYFEQGPLLDALKDQIKRILPAETLITARATFDKGGKLNPTYLADFATEIQRTLEAAIDRHIALVSAIEQRPDFALQRERNEHHAFAEQKRKVFVGRENNLAAIASYIASGRNYPLILHGRSGFGKSAVMANAIAAAEESGVDPLIYRFIGASAKSSDLRSLLISLVEDLAGHDILQQPGEFEQDANRFSDQIKTLLSSVTKPIVICLDALDQLRKPYRLGWLPDTLPTALKLVVSVLDDEAYETDSAIYGTLRQRLAPEAFVEIEPLGVPDALKILTALESGSRRRLQRGQRDYILGQFEKAGASPLYLRTAFEIARSWKSSDRAGTGSHILAEDTAALIAQFMRDLSVVHHHPPELVTRTLGYLTAAKDGLSEKELTDVLSRDRGVMQAISSEKHGARTDQLPASVWVRLNRQLAPFLTEKRIDDQPLLQFFHRQVAQVAREQHYEAAKSGKAALHAALADYFESRSSTRDGEAGRSFYEKRSLSELPYQLHYAESTSRLDQILLSPDWMQQKLAAFDPQTLVADYEQFGRGQMQNFIGRTLRLTTGILARDPQQLHPQLVGRLMAYSDPAARDFLDRTRRLIKGPALLTQRLSLTPPGAETARLEGHTAPVDALVVLPDGRLASGSRDGTSRLWDLKSGAETTRLEGHTPTVLPDGRLALVSSDNAIRLWDPKTGAETARLEGNTHLVDALVVLPDGRLASGSRDGTIRLWDLKSGAEAARLDGHTDVVNALAVLPDGRLASGSYEDDETIRLWDLGRGAETARFEGTDGVNALVVLPDGRLASASWDKTIRLWDLKSASESTRLEGHIDVVNALAVLPDGRLASGSWDRTVRLWHLNSGVESARLEGHSDRVLALAVLPDGRLASGSYDNTIRLWDLESTAAAQQEGQLREPDTPVGDRSGVTELAVLPDGRVASGSWDKTIRLWDPNSGTEIARLEGHTDLITAMVVLPNGRLASGSSHHDKTIRLWDPNTGTETGRIEGLDREVNALAVLPDGRLAVGMSSYIRLWDPNTCAETACFEKHDEIVLALVVLPDGRLASGSSSNTIQFWDANSGAETSRLVTHDWVNVLAVLHDGRLASGCGSYDHYDTSIRLWDLKSGTESARLEGHIDVVNALALLPDGRLASASSDKTIRLWDPNSGKEVSRLEVDAEVKCLAALPSFDRKGCRLVAGDGMGRLHWLEIVD